MQKLLLFFELVEVLERLGGDGKGNGEKKSKRLRHPGFDVTPTPVTHAVLDTASCKIFIIEPAKRIYQIIMIL